MEYQKISNLINKTTDQPSKYQTEKWIKINDQSNGNYNNNDIKINTKMLRSKLCDYAEAYILVKGTITVVVDPADEINVAFKNCAPFISCKTIINNVEIDDAKYIDIVMPMYNLIEYSENYNKTTGSLWSFKKDLRKTNNNGVVDDALGTRRG